MQRTAGLGLLLVGVAATLTTMSVASAAPTCASVFQSLKTPSVDSVLVYQNDKGYSANDLFLKDVRKLIKKDLTLERINKKVDVKWMGPSKLKWPHFSELNYEQQLSAAELEWHRTDYGRDALTQFTRVLWAISVEQARREIRSSVFTRARYGLIRAAYDLTQGKTQHALEMIRGALAELKAKHIDAREENLVMNGEKAEWPSGDAPANTRQLATLLSKSLLQMYKVTSKTGEDPKALLIRKIENILSAYTVEAHRFLDTEYTHGLEKMTDDLAWIEEAAQSLVNEPKALSSERMTLRTIRDIRTLIERMDPATYTAYLEKRLNEDP